ncbi:MAG: transcriptional repressor LexA [Burkholderiaceae bacterium]|jgi:repressor LexA|nr:transcriptional repressor LexA [Burkholderiaceae bacterium]HCO56645.1 repressor LexA [Burkholderiales bacterium]MDP4677433.1 transcriptional repressor LexA [Burkholderiaceae bacterium]MDP4828549.1 transcriptional repressor LexA [Burkholderiaceae bacterium]MDP4919055.1 transcriptional repressor LexA [Burkholderiaceae bacterium]
MQVLTERQNEILRFIAKHIEDTGFPPTRLDICSALGFKSPNAAETHLKALAKKGAISMVPGASRSIRLITNLVTTAQNLVEQLSIPLVGRVAAGSPILAQEHLEAQYQIDPQLFPMAPDYLLKVRGMSMRNAGILHDDLLAVKRLSGGLSETRDGQIVVARLEEDVTVKRFKRDGKKIVLLPENPDFEPIVVDPSQDFLAIEGLAVGVIRNPRSGL